MMHDSAIPLDYAVPDDFPGRPRPGLVCEPHADGAIIHVRPIGGLRAGLPAVSILLAAALAVPPLIETLCLRGGSVSLDTLATSTALLAELAAFALAWRLFGRCDLALRRYEFRVDPHQLHILSSGPAGRWAQRWPRATIRDIWIEPPNLWRSMHVVMMTRTGDRILVLPGDRPENLAVLNRLLRERLGL